MLTKVQVTSRHLRTSASGANATSSPCVGIFSTTRYWDAVLGFETSRETFDVSLGETTAVCFHTNAEAADDRDPRAELRNTADVLRKFDINCVLVLCSHQRRGGASDTLFVVDDHVNWSGDNPLIGMRSSLQGERFVDMAHAYDPAICATLLDAARDAGIPVEQGVAVDEPPDPQQRTMGGQKSVTGLASPVIVARQVGARVGAVVCVEQEQCTANGTSAGVQGYDMEGLRRFLEIAVSSMAVHTGV